MTNRNPLHILQSAFLLIEMNTKKPVAPIFSSPSQMRQKKQKKTTFRANRYIQTTILDTTVPTILRRKS